MLRCRTLTPTLLNQPALKCQQRWVELAADWLRPLYECILTGVLGGGYVQIDETPIRYLVPGNGQTKQGFLWTAHRPRGDVVYRWETTRAATCLENIVPIDFTGTIQCDGYAGYGAFAHRRPGAITLAGCWRMCGESFRTRSNRPRAPLAGACGRSKISTGSKPNCASIGPGPACAKPCAPTKAAPSWNGSSKPSCS